ncbi:unnamed protein product [Oppiella nova]|uniref:Choline kinase n=1 Tax=Oppiella nova TaxID=334625 RepID=A0A7R9LTU9_9ACAR|nr:unnamed protein product [Oppiella nova]CAG2166894.1 unnamed protein product [Oppiella nova]
MSSNDCHSKSLKDLKAGEEFDLEKVVLIRGQTPHGIKERCLQLCRDYLAHNWIQQTVDSIQVRTIPGSLNNELYYCGVNEPSLTSTAPQEVVIRLYGRKVYNNLNSDGNERLKDMRSERLSDVITSLMLSETQLGPKIYGLFEDGQIQHYYQHRHFKLEEQNNLKLVEELFRKIARVHALDVPLPKKHWIFREMDLNCEEAYRRPAINEMIEGLNCETIKSHDLKAEVQPAINEMIEGLNCETIKSHDLKAEVQWLKDMSVKIDSPLVFSHNDLFSSNVLVLDNETASGDQLVICDYEYSSYGFRGMDLGTIINEWGRLRTDILTVHTFADDSTIKQLLQYYVSENEIIFGKSWSQNGMNSTEQLLKEVKFC